MYQTCICYYVDIYALCVVYMFTVYSTGTTQLNLCQCSAAVHYCTDCLT